MEDQSSQPKLYIIEHMEEFLYDWCLAEYQQILKYLYNTNSKMVITNADSYLNYDKDEFKQNNIDNIKQYENSKNDSEYKNLTYYLNDKIDFFINKKSEIMQIPKQCQSEGSDIYQIPFNRICLLDLRATEVLKPEDSQNFDAFIFGGILGDHPPKDRTKGLRNIQCQTRHLGDMQLSTDTAVLTCRLIIENKMKFEDIPLIREPEFSGRNEKGIYNSIIMEGFSYIQDNYDWKEGKFIEKNKELIKPLISEKIFNDMLFEEIDFSKM